MGERALIWTRGRSSRNTSWERAVANGLIKNGIACDVMPWRGADKQRGVKMRIAEYDFQVCWGVGHEAFLKLAEYAKQTLIIELPYYGIRSAMVMRSPQNIRRQSVSLSWGGLNGRADFCGSLRPSDRWLRNGPKIEPYREWKESDVVVIAGQVEADFSHKNLVAIHEWYRRAAVWVRSQTDLPIVFRNHPKAKGQVSVSDWGIAGCSVSDIPKVNDELRRCRHLVVFNSNMVVDAAIQGVPALAWDRGAMAYELNSLEIGMPPLESERKQWACDIAYCQWRFSEVWKGKFWPVLGSRIRDREVFDTAEQLHQVRRELVDIKVAVQQLNKGKELQ